MVEYADDYSKLWRRTGAGQGMTTATLWTMRTPNPVYGLFGGGSAAEKPAG